MHSSGFNSSSYNHTHHTAPTEEDRAESWHSPDQTTALDQSKVVKELLNNKDLYDKILQEHNKKNPPNDYQYLTPSKAALFGLLCRFRD